MDNKINDPVDGYIENSISGRYIRILIQNGMTKRMAIEKGVEQHLYDLKQEVEYMEKQLQYWTSSHWTHAV